MRHVRILNLFMFNSLPQQPVRKSLTNCVACGRFQMLPTASQPSAWSFAATATAAAAAAAAAGRRHASSSQQKYAHLQVNARPAEPSIAITKLARQGRTNEALAVYLQLIQEGGFPSRESLYQLTRALYKSSNLQGMVAIRDTLIAHYSNSNSISSNSISSTSSLAPRPASKREARSMIYTYTMLINVMAKHKLVNLETIRLLCKEISQFTTKTSIVLYNTLIKTLLETNQPSQAHAIFEDLLISTTLSPTISTYTILMKDASVRKQYGRLLNYLNDMQSRDITITYALVSIVVDTLCDIKEFERAVHVVNAIHHPRKRDELSSPKYRLQLLKQIEIKQKIEEAMQRNKNRRIARKRRIRARKKKRRRAKKEQEKREKKHLEKLVS